MTSFRVTLALVLVMVSMLLVAGCAGERPVNNQPVNVTITAAPPVPTSLMTTPVTPVRTICTVYENKSFWITIHPIGSIERGETLWISGTTNVPVGKHLDLNIYSASFHPHCRCCYDDQLTADVIIRGGEGCANTFSLWFDSTSFAPDEYIISARYPDNNTESNTLIVPLFENTTPLPAPTGDLPVTAPTGSLLAALRPQDVHRGDIQTITGIINGTPYAVEYSIRDARIEAVCRPLCPGENYHGIIHAQESSNGRNRFTLRFDTGNMKPGPYVADLKLTCIETDSPVMVFFNVTPESSVTAP